MAKTIHIKHNTQPGGASAKQYDGPATGKSFTQASRLAIMLLALSILVYANTLKNGYALDDFGAITKNTIVTRGVSAIPELLSTPYHQGYNPSPNDLYRPLSLVMFAIEYQLFDANPALGHFLNILLFGGCVALLFLFLDQLFDGRKTAIAFIASLLFALHPIHTEVVANIKSRDELLCFFFGFLSLRQFTRYATSGSIAPAILGALCFFLSLLSKETSITFLAIIPLIFYGYKNDNKKHSHIITGLAVLTAALYLGIRMAVLQSHHADNFANIDFIDNALVRVPAGSSRLATAMLMMGYYIRLLLIPYPLVCDYAIQ